MRKELAIEGLSFTVLSLIHCETELAIGELVRMLPGWRCAPPMASSCYPHRRGLSLKKLLQHLKEIRG